MKSFWAAIGAAGIIVLSGFFMGCDNTSIFKIGDVTPDFTMPDQYNEETTLSEVLSEEGMNGAILAFYILDNSPG